MTKPFYNLLGIAGLLICIFVLQTNYSGYINDNYLKENSHSDSYSGLDRWSKLSPLDEYGKWKYASDPTEGDEFQLSFGYYEIRGAGNANYITTFEIPLMILLRIDHSV